MQNQASRAHVRALRDTKGPGTPGSPLASLPARSAWRRRRATSPVSAPPPGRCWLWWQTSARFPFNFPSRTLWFPSKTLKTFGNPTKILEFLRKRLIVSHLDASWSEPDRRRARHVSMSAIACTWCASLVSVPSSAVMAVAKMATVLHGTQHAASFYTSDYQHARECNVFHPY